MSELQENQSVQPPGLPEDLSDFVEIEYMDMDSLEVEGAPPPPPPERAKPAAVKTSIKGHAEKQVRGDVALTLEALEEAPALDEEAASPKAGEETGFTVGMEGLAEIEGAGVRYRAEARIDEKALREKIEKEYQGLTDVIMDRIPDDFKISGIGAVDLMEAEEIARETLLVIDEKEILDQLEELRDLVIDRKKGIEESEELEAREERPPDSMEPAHYDGLGEEKTPQTIHDVVSKPGAHFRGDRDRGLSGTDIDAEVMEYAVEGTSGGKEPYGDVLEIDVFGDGAYSPPRQTGEALLPAGSEPEAGVPDTGAGVSEPDREAMPLPSRAERAAVTGSREILPRWSLPEAESGVLFIDDLLVDKNGSGSGGGLEVSDLEKITSDLVGIEVGQAIVLPEGDLITDDSIPHANDLKYLQDEFIFEFVDEFKYRDDELEFIHTSIIEDDYGTYLREIDAFDTVKGEKGVSRAVELFGLTDQELEGVYDKLFAEEYKDIDLQEIFDFFREDSIKRGLGPSIAKECMYVSDVSGVLDEKERSSIEEDVSSANALIFEENINDIRRLLGKPPKEESGEKVELVDEIRDITDRVVIIDDEDDIDRFIKDFPDEKRAGLRRLLKYLDGLFEKLPEKTVKTFADSEYFDLYVKVMNDLEV